MSLTCNRVTTSPTPKRCGGGGSLSKKYQNCYSKIYSFRNIDLAEVVFL